MREDLFGMQHSYGESISSLEFLLIWCTLDLLDEERSDTARREPLEIQQKQKAEASERAPIAWDLYTAKYCALFTDNYQN